MKKWACFIMLAAMAAYCGWLLGRKRKRYVELSPEIWRRHCASEDGEGEG